MVIYEKVILALHSWVHTIYSLSEQSLGRAIALPPGVGIGISKMLKFYAKVFYVLGKALIGELSCP